MRYPAIAAILLFVTALLAVGNAFERWQWGTGATALLAVVTAGWCIISVPIAAYTLWRDERTARSASEEELRIALAPLPVRGSVLRFETLDYMDFTDKPLPTDEEMVRQVTGPEPFTHFAHLQLENPGTPTRAINFQFTIRLQDGTQVVGRAVSGDWDAPSRWPKHIYFSLDEIAATFLQTYEVYNVFVDVRLAYPINKLDMRSFEARFIDSSGSVVVCTMLADYDAVQNSASMPNS